jgi:hypothetical protein
MERANRAASEAAFAHFNAGRQDDAVDLHGLYVKEALERARSAIREAKAQVRELHAVPPHRHRILPRRAACDICS